MIIEEHNLPHALFGTIDLGEVFRYEGELYIKIDKVGNTGNVFNCTTHNKYTFCHDMTVYPVNYALVIK